MENTHLSRSGLTFSRLALDADALARLAETFPGRRAAPEDYAW